MTQQIQFSIVCETERQFNLADMMPVHLSAGNMAFHQHQKGVLVHPTCFELNITRP